MIRLDVINRLIISAREIIDYKLVMEFKKPYRTDNTTMLKALFSETKSKKIITKGVKTAVGKAYFTQVNFTHFVKR